MNNKVNFSPEQLVSSSQLVRGLAHKLEQTKIHPLFIQKNHEVKWVLMSLEDYKKMQVDGVNK